MIRLEVVIYKEDKQDKAAFKNSWTRKQLTIAQCPLKVTAMNQRGKIYNAP